MVCHHFTEGNPMKKFLVACAATLMATTAYAADAVVEEVVAVEVDAFSWTGFYVGVHGGYGWTNGDWSLPVAPGIDVVSEGDLDDFLVGAHAGAQYQFDNNVVLGVEVDIQYRNGEDSAGFFVNGTEILPGLTLDSELNWTGSARLRAGYAMDRWLPYITGGLAFADYEANLASGGVAFPPVLGTTIDETSVGWTIGGGAEYAFTDNLIFRAEYRYSNFGTEDVFLILPVAAPGQEFELESHDLTIGVSYKF